MAQFKIAHCPHCGARVLRRGQVMLNIVHNPAGINHHLTCEKWPHQDQIPEPPDAA